MVRRSIWAVVKSTVPPFHLLGHERLVPSCGLSPATHFKLLPKVCVMLVLYPIQPTHLLVGAPVVQNKAIARLDWHTLVLKPLGWVSYVRFPSGVVVIFGSQEDLALMGLL